MNQLHDISVVIPVYNSKSSLNELLERITKTLTNYNHEIILVDDGSKDGSWGEIVELKKAYNSSLKAARLKRNYGQHNAIICGFSLAKGKFIVTMDDDLQHPPEEILKLIETQKTTHSEIVLPILYNDDSKNLKKEKIF